MIGLDGVVVEVEVDTGGDCPRWSSLVCRMRRCESRERVQSAVVAGFYYPRKKLTAVPASVRKEGPAYDLPLIAVGVLIATSQLDPETVEDTFNHWRIPLDGGGM